MNVLDDFEKLKRNHKYLNNSEKHDISTYIAKVVYT